MKIEEIYSGNPVTAAEILDRREERAAQQRDFLLQGGVLVCFGLNIAGNMKQFRLAREAFNDGMVSLQAVLYTFSPRVVWLQHANTGSESMILVEGDPLEIKAKTTYLEENHPLGRLFDIDVIGSDGLPISRTKLGQSPRQCLLCQQTAKICARSKAHSLKELRTYTARLLINHYARQTADKVAQLATRALLYEVSITPKPGLVDRMNNGSHKDMNLFTFIDSSTVLTPWFREFFQIGWDTASQSPQECFSRLRAAGLQAERSMFAATQGVNTHKGMIFSMGILCAALGRSQPLPERPIQQSDFVSVCRDLGICSQDIFSALPHTVRVSEKTSGLSCFYQYRIPGVRGEAACGFPTVFNLAIPAFRNWSNKGCDFNGAAALTLLSMIAEVEDTNMIHRGGLDGAVRARTQALDLLKKVTPQTALKALIELDQDFVDANLSPGGCADLLALCIMTLFLEQENLLLLSE